MYRVELREHHYLEGCSAWDAVTLTREIELPFVPVAGLRLGLEKDSEFNFDDLEIRRVLWLTHPGKFLAEISPSRYSPHYRDYFRKALRSLIRRGWQCHLDDPSDSIAKAHNGDDGYFYIIHTPNGYLAVNAIEVACLEWQGVEFTVVSEPKP
jgi:hypothetical protein